jgi:hypothetical protein
VLTDPAFGGTLSRKSWLSTLRSTPTKVRLARLVALTGKHWSCTDTASGQRTDPDDTDVLQPGHTAAGFQDSEGNQMMLIGR